MHSVPIPPHAPGPRPAIPALPSGFLRIYDSALVSSMTLHHVRDVPAVLRHSFTLLVPGGRLAVADLDTEDGSFHPDPAGIHHHGFDRTWIRTQLESAGFQSVSVTDVCEMPRMLPDGTTRTYPLFLATAIRP